MSSFICEHCGTHIIDTPDGYITGCEHYRLPEKKDMTETTFFKIPTIEISIKECHTCDYFKILLRQFKKGNKWTPVYYCSEVFKGKIIQNGGDFIEKGIPDWCSLKKEKKK